MSERNKKYTFFFSLSSVFSNFHPSLFTVKGIVFISNEQFMMYCKAMLFKDKGNAEKILSVNNNWIASDFIAGRLTSDEIVRNHFKEWNRLMMSVKSIGRNVYPYNDAVWNANRKKHVKFGVMEKFSQNADMLKKLHDTGDTKMVEASKYDRIWGIGLSERDACAVPESQWPGLNLLGEIFNELKAGELKKEPG